MNLEVVIESYTVNVDGEDQIDQQNSAGGFASEFLGWKGFLKVFLAIPDTMVNNRQVAWDFSGEDYP